MGLGRRVIVSLVLMAIVTVCCVKATIAEEAAKDKSWTDWAKEKIGLKHEENIPTTHTTTTVRDNVGATMEKSEGAYETAKSKARETIGSVKDKASQSYDSVGQVKDDLSHKSKQVKNSLSGDNTDKSWTDWAKEKNWNQTRRKLSL
ncbi:Late embryogenesis abundant protein (LEA) family protein [Raphanus sativus]|nr:Late embryogenesis abundant protein (LEA) family protein [Raphanus sativus]